MDTKAFHKISYGLYVIGAAAKGHRLNAQIANTVIQVCSEKPMISVALNKNNLTHEIIEASKAFSVSILGLDTPLNFIGNLGFKSGREIDKLAGINYGMGRTGAPVIYDNAIATLEAKVVSTADALTHTVFIGEVVAADVIRQDEPMTYAYYQQVKRGTTPKSAPSYQEKKPETEKTTYECTVCGYVYDPELGDPEHGIKAGTSFTDLPEDWTCPVCGAGKDKFKQV